MLIVKDHADILLVTVTKVESSTVMEVFGDAIGRVPALKPVGDMVYHDLGEINGAKVMMVQSEMGTSGLGASQQTVQQGIADLSPSAVIMVGIAFGINSKKQAIGDILVSQRLMAYEPQRVGTEGGQPNHIP